MTTQAFEIVTDCKIEDLQTREKGAGLLTYPYSIRHFTVIRDTTEPLKTVGMCARLIWMQQYIKSFKSTEDWKALIFSINSAILPSTIRKLFMFLDMERRLCYIWWEQEKQG
jgi:hypothetical protein